MRLVSRVSVKKTAPLVWSDPQASFGGDLHDLGVVFSSQCVVSSELFLQLHQRAVSVALCHLGFQSLFSFKIEVCVYLSIHLEAACTIEKLDDVADRSLARLGEVRLQPLDHEHHQHLAKQKLTKSNSDIILSTAVTFLERAEPSSSARRTSLRTSSCMAGPRN